eukprot:766967-Hanusia_phi.AAC.7
MISTIGSVQKHLNPGPAAPGRPLGQLTRITDGIRRAARLSRPPRSLLRSRSTQQMLPYHPNLSRSKKVPTHCHPAWHCGTGGPGPPRQRVTARPRPVIRAGPAGARSASCALCLYVL